MDINTIGYSSSLHMSISSSVSSILASGSRSLGYSLAPSSTTSSESGFLSSTLSTFLSSITTTPFITGSALPVTSTTSQNVQELSALLSCNAASFHWLSTATYFANTTSLTSEGCKSCTVTYITPRNATPYTTLCDGTPRAHGSATWTWLDRPSSTYNVTYPVKMTPSTGSDKPACTINSLQCTEVYSYLRSSYSADLSAYSSSTEEGMSAKSPEFPTAACTSTYQLPACEPAKCYLYGGPIQLAFWPITVSGDLCGNRSTIYPDISIAQTASTFGTTVISPKVLISISTLYAVDGCGTTIGAPLSNYILPQQPQQISTQCMTYHAGFKAGNQINFADFNSPVPASAYNCQPQCNGGSDGFGHIDYCSTFYDDFNPYLAFPTDVWSLNPSWKSCSFMYDGNILSDPPVALTPATVAAGVTVSSASTSVVALPASATATVVVNTSPAAPASTAISVTATSKANDPAAKPSSSSSKVIFNDPPDPPSTSKSIAKDPGNPQSWSTSIASTVATDSRSSSTTANIANVFLSTIGALPQPLSTVAILGSQAIILDPSNSAAIVIGSTSTITSGQTAIVVGQTVAVGSGMVVVGTTTHPLVFPTAPSTNVAGAIITAGSSTMLAISKSGAVVVGDVTVSAGQTTVLAGQTIAAASTGLVVNGNTIAFSANAVSLAPAPQPSGTVIAFGFSTTLTIQPTDGAVIINGQSLTAGQITTIADQTVSAGTSAIIVGNSTIQIPRITPTPITATGAVVPLGSTSLTVVQSNGTIIINGESITNGQATVIAGQTISDVSSALILDGKTVSFSSILATITQAPVVVTIQPSSLTIVGNNGGIVNVNGATLTPGQTTLTAGKTISDASTAVVVDGSTIPLSQVPGSSTTARGSSGIAQPYTGSAGKLHASDYSLVGCLALLLLSSLT